ncbi:hypothetical protein B9Q03_06100 [Candidatus Marsarchaeota G2 archaeon OSP_D]|jgi:DNA-binding Lrp family transcriptional regulator|uniref:HTH marR-type domain-containing protein n=6 Tax=Candidatus Marsarchaeota group 2 TaxID=2203771 RepID=A0A2R6C685_9ARCH|nr:MAG: hypothetical protein B9Q03_06100 [Candidatus Marsarchaeota G2 archaeon OSP_D]PSN93830.1 MAG: hypothetical protein B9Q06_11075 [Candidatus Marsarchaeota G2 archaeon ECH_B_2]PSN96950.1 MAG: hypothetical protein B9Q09_01940 [Candidatus Marsarchaeota G2 archaeon ECH_B_SAG-C16]PSN97059.1 MAG: hypothetical protein B9Q07_12505 [Candidatus Marsarchaeota G2 archaeon ECH_B_3]PSN99905.1 MAG: hypothetical protein B9Q05_11095 [Candidatus Marsarchaeota G2 archaeon ECH_B_1]PSO06422.1 MAG: hypothetica
MSIEGLFDVKRFGEGRLDSKDRRILEALYESGDLKFNELAKRVRSEVSRATLVGRLEKLVRLGYLQRKKVEADRRSVIITLNPLAYMLMFTLEQTRSRVRTLRVEIEKLKPTEVPEDELIAFLKDASRKLSSAYSMTTNIALLFGVEAATEVFLPMLIEEYRGLAQTLTRLFTQSPNIAHSYLSSVLTNESLNQFRELKLSLEKKGLREYAKTVELFTKQYNPK